MGNIGLSELLIVLIVLVPTLVALVDLLRTPADVWQRAGQQQLVWLLVVLFGGAIGAILYFVIPRRALVAARARG